MSANFRARLARAEHVALPPARRVITLQLAYASVDIDWDTIPPYAGVTYLILPQKAPSVEAWHTVVQARYEGRDTTL